MQSSRSGSLVVRVRMMGWAAGMTAIMLGHGCFIQETNLNYCSNVNGDTFCDLRHGGERPYCLYGSEACWVGLTAEQRQDPSFDGCLESEPPSECYSPCGGGTPQEERGACVGSGGETGLAESSTSGMEVESSGGTTSEVSADGTSSGEMSTTGATSECGNGEIEDGEECDGTDLGMETCEAAGFDEGTLDCTEACTLDTSNCRRCGNDILEAGEQCDGTDYGGHGCESEGFGGGILNCAPGCVFDTSGCTLCGDGHREGSEQCDGAELGGQNCMSLGFSGGDLACNPTCSAYNVSGCTLCGDGLREGNEVCDGNDLHGQTCLTIAGSYTGGDLACASDCLGLDAEGCYASSCHNGEREPDEVCDAGEYINDWTCDDFGFYDGSLICADCMTIDVSGCNNCGDGVVDAEELCDTAVPVEFDCSDLGYATGTVACADDCLGYVGCTPYDGPCCESFDGAVGCSIPACAAIVCLISEGCCGSSWEGECAVLAQNLPECGCTP